MAGAPKNIDDRGRRPAGRQVQQGTNGSKPAQGKTNVVLSGFSAMRDVRRAARDAEEAQRRIAELQASLEGEREQLAHRSEVERSYPQIIASQTATIEKTQGSAQDAQARIDLATAHRTDLSGQLDEMKALHEEHLRPYREIMESTKGRSDDSSRALADARRATKSAEGQAADAAKRRDQRIAQANRAVDSAQDRLRRTETELNRLQGSADASPAAVSKLRDEAVTEHAHVDAARRDVAAITAEEQQYVDTAQERLWQQKQALEAAERQATAAKDEANKRRSEYDTLYKRATAEEKALEEQIGSCDRDLGQARNDLHEAKAQIERAQGLIDEANRIHATPEETEALRKRIAAAQADLAKRTKEAHALQAHEAELRSSTRQSRFISIATVAGVLVVLIVLAWLIFFRPAPAPTSSETSSTTTQTTQTTVVDGGTSGTSTTSTSDGTTSSANGTSSTTSGTSTGTNSNTTSGTSSSTSGTTSSSTKDDSTATSGTTSGASSSTSTTGGTSSTSSTSSKEGTSAATTTKLS